MHKLVRLGVLAGALVGASAAHAQFAKPEDAIKFRQAKMLLQANFVGRIGAVVKGVRPYDKDQVLSYAQTLDTLSQAGWDGFPPGSDQGGQTRALPAIWQDAAKFQAAQKKLEDATANLVKAAQSGDLGNVKQAFGPVAQACKGCHDDFRKD